MSGALVAIVGLGLLAGGAIVLIDSLVLRRIRRQREEEADRDEASDSPRR